MRLVSLFLLLTAVSTAFISPQPWGIRCDATTQRFMFSADEDTKPAPATSLAMEAPVVETSRPKARNIVKDMNTGEVREVKWVDPAMAANTNPLKMNW